MPLVILGHPNYSKSLANKAVVDALSSSDLDIEVRNIYAMYPDYQIDAKAEQAALLKHHAVVFQYPLYWYNMPAILKQWFDTVFEYQFAYGSQGDKLKNKLFIPSFTVGAPEEEYGALGEHHFRVDELCKNLEQTAYYAKMQYIDPFYFHGTSIHAGYTEDAVRANAAQQASRLIQRLQNRPSA